jgi:ABC-2 type transport system permease protein
LIELNAIYVIVMRELKKFLRERSRLVSTMARPLLWLFLVGAGLSRLVAPEGGLSYTQFIFPGIVGMTILFSAIFSSISIIWDKEFGFLKEILVAPVRRSSIVLGKALSGTAVSTLQVAVVLLLLPLVDIRLGPWEVLATLLVAALLAFTIASLGIVIATFYESYESFSVIMNFVVMPMFFLSGAMYPVKLLPLLLRYASSINPLTYGVDALKHIMFDLAQGPMSPDFTLGTDLAVLLSCSVLFVALGSRLFARVA